MTHVLTPERHKLRTPRTRLRVLLSALSLGAWALGVAGAPTGLLTELSANRALGADKGGGTIRLITMAEPRELDPGLATGSAESHIIYQLFEGLTAPHPLTLEPMPGAASAWTISPDGKTYTFTLRPGLKWSDGQPLKAKDFVWSWTRVLQPTTAAQYAEQLYVIKNARAFHKGQIKDPAQVGVSAPSDTVVKVTLEYPVPYFLHLTAFYTFFPTPRHVIEKHEGLAWTKPGVLVGNGPFRLTDWQLNRHIKVERNDNYWDKNTVKLAGATFLPVENLETADRMFQAGEAEVLDEVVNLKIPKYKKESEAQGSLHPFRLSPALATYFYKFNVTKKPFDDVRVRRALTLAIDRTLIVERVTKGGQTPATAMVPPGAGKDYRAQDLLPKSADDKSLQEAKRLLAEAGYPGGKGFPKSSILYNTSENHKIIAVAIQQMWKKNLGIDVELVNQEWKVYLNTLREGQFELARAGWIGDYPDPNNFLETLTSGNALNDSRYSNPTFDKLLARAASERDAAKRLDTLREAERTMIGDLPILPIYFYTRAQLVAPKVRIEDPLTGKTGPWESNIRSDYFLKYYRLAP